MFSNFHRRMKDNRGFNMIELMVVVVIIGILAAIAVPIYSKYAKNARVTEATGKMGDILTAAKSYAIEFEGTLGDPVGPATAAWPATCGSDNFIGDCTATENFTYALAGTPGGAMTITATGIGKMAGVTVKLEMLGDPSKNGKVTVINL